MYRSNHFESQNVGQGLAAGQSLSADQSSAKRPNQPMAFTSNAQAVETNGYTQHSSANLSQAPYSQPPATPNLQRHGLAQHQNFAQNSAAHNLAPQSDLVSQTSRSLSTNSLDSGGSLRQEQTAPLSLSARVEQGQRTQHNEAPREETRENKHEVDPQISALFTAMGKASQLSHSQLAARLQTSPGLISALETGSLHDLPQWEELEPVIRRYADFMNIDDRAILRRLREQLTEHYLTNMTADQQAHMTSALSFNKETPPPLNTRSSQKTASIMPASDLSLKAFANGNLSPQNSGQGHYNASGEMKAAHTLNSQTIEERFTALSSAVTSSQNATQNFAHPQMNPHSQTHLNGLGNGDPINNQGQAPLNGIAGQQGNYTNPQFINTAAQQEGNVSVALGQAKVKPKIKWMRIFGNFALVMILLVGFINWQPNRFWSGVDQLPKPISKSIYTLFEFVMPDPLASVYRMNWVHVADPRMRKADKLVVPTVRKLPRIDFSKLGSLNN